MRKFTSDDLEAFFNIMKDEEVNKFLPWFLVTTKEQAKTLLEKKYISRYKQPLGFYYAICLIKDNIPIGYVNVSGKNSHDFGYGLQKEFWNKGIATEACKGVLKELKKTDIPFITATHDVNNLKSGNVLKKIGMKYCYSYEELWQPKNILVTFRMYQLNLDENIDRIYMEYWDKYPVHFIENI